MKIGLDCDGVICNFLKAFYEEGNRIWPGRLDTNYQNQQWFDLQGLNDDEVNKVWERIKTTPNWWMTLDAYRDAIAALQMFLYQNHGHDIYLCTSRVPSVGSTVAFQTNVWLKACGVEAGNNYIGVVPIAHGNDKIKFYVAAEVHFSLDDRGDSVEYFDHHDKGVHQACLLSRPWNRDAQVKRRVTSVQEFLDFALASTVK